MMDLKTLAAEVHNSKLERPKYDDVETQYCLWVAASSKKGQCTSSAVCGSGDSVPHGTLAAEIAAARKKIQDTLKEPNAVQASSTSGDFSAVTKRVDVLEKENKDMRHELKELKHIVEKLQSTIDNLSKSSKGETPTGKAASTAPKKVEAEDEIDLFGSDDEEESEEQAKIREERLKAYEEKKSKKPGPIAKSSVVLEVKPWDDETDMKEMERRVRSIQMDGLVWGASKLVPVGYGIQKLQIMLVVEDDKVSIEELQEKIEENEDYVQSVDIAAFNKI
jgi:translation elongation factor EF-1beta